MPPRRVNDAQSERLLTALKCADGKPGLSQYGKTLVKKISDREGINPRSVERRLQRYITTAGERRSFVRAPVRQQRIVRQIVRRDPPPIQVKSKKEKVKRQEPEPEREPEREAYGARALRGFEDEFADEETTSLYELRAIIAYFDGDTREAGKALRVDARLLDLASQGTTITRRMGAGRIDEGVRKLYGVLAETDRQDIQDFSDLLYNLPDWRIGMVLDDLGNGDTTFAEWIDVWRDDDMDIDAEDSEFWALWRNAYNRAMG